MYDPRCDSTAWKDAVKMILTRSVPELDKCEICDSLAVMDMSLYQQASGAFTGYSFLCKECARSLGFTLMIDGD